MEVGSGRGEQGSAEADDAGPALGEIVSAVEETVAQVSQRSQLHSVTIWTVTVDAWVGYAPIWKHESGLSIWKPTKPSVGHGVHLGAKSPNTALSITATPLCPALAIGNSHGLCCATAASEASIMAIEKMYFFIDK